MTPRAADRERRLLHTIIRLVENVTSTQDHETRLQVLVDESVALFDADAAGLMLFEPSQRLQIAASAGHHSGLLELLQLETGEGPCLESAHTGTVVSVPDIASAAGRWPHFCRAAVDAGYAAVHSMPLRLRTTAIGSLNLFRRTAQPFDLANAAAAHALADIAAITITQQRALDTAVTTQAQLQAALESRKVIEQAKGWVASRNLLDTDTAFTLLRDHARRNQLPLTEVALAVLAGRITLGTPTTGDTRQP
ncbi:ANTAR domain-containing protein [Curtobacterium sp. AB7]|uniref:ANTAR domain-containing protein n=1 Tax=Curtobacterium sp. AB7 TaxID=3349327 RepID=UPI0038369C2D